MNHIVCLQIPIPSLRFWSEMPSSPPVWWWQLRKHSHISSECRRRSRRKPQVTWWTHEKLPRPSSLPWLVPCRSICGPQNSSTAIAWRASSSTWPSVLQTTWHRRSVPPEVRQCQKMPESVAALFFFFFYQFIHIPLIVADNASPLIWW